LPFFEEVQHIHTQQACFWGGFINFLSYTIPNLMVLLIWWKTGEVEVV
jgi:hypothetical protein